MSSSRHGSTEGVVMLHSSGGVRNTCVLTQHPAAVANEHDSAEPLDDSAVHSSPIIRETGAGDIMCKGLFCRLIVVIGLCMMLCAVGTLLFISGFFLSRDDLPFISDGRVIPFPPLFPHLDPARLLLNKEEGVYYVENNSPRAMLGTSEHVNADGAPRPLYVEHFTHPPIPASSDTDPCQTTQCRSSWVSVTPYDRVVVFLIDAMRFDFLLWDPKASNACEDDSTKECTSAPPELRPFYRNRLPLAHDLLRRSDADLKRFLLSLIESKGSPRVEEGNRAVAVQNDPSPREAPVSPGVTDPHQRSGSSPSVYNWGGNRFTRLYVFEADPPTATTQRLTGLATGSMPSFFSVWINGISDQCVLTGHHEAVRETFSASAVDVDSLLLQLKAANKTSVAIGDDTWGRSFGHLLTRVHAFPSLNIQDLHTVDDGVAAELPREFGKGDWSFLVGHVLGVDHVGHAAVLDSDLMHRKLTEMNGMIKDTLKLVLKNNSNTVTSRQTQTLFLVFGDHGMTEAGSHGGGSSEEVEAGLLSFSTLPAMLSPRAAQMLSPGTRLFAGRLPAYLQNHGAFCDSTGRRRVDFGSALDAASPTAALGYGSRRIRQVGLAPTLALLMGIPIPFNSMGRIIADVVPSIASFVPECFPEALMTPLNASKCGADDGKACSEGESEDHAVARRVRCSDLAYLTQLHHIAAWQQHRAVVTNAALTGNGAVLTDPQFAAAKAKWLKLYSELDKEIKSLPTTAHAPLNSGSLAPNSKAREFDATISLPIPGLDYADAELISNISRLSQTRAGGDASSREEAERIWTSEETTAGAASALPSLVPYLLASAEFSREAWQASVRQLCTFNIMLMLCGIFMALSSLTILGLAAWALRNSFRGDADSRPEAPAARSLPEGVTIARWLCVSTCIGAGTWAALWVFLEIFRHLLAEWASALHVFLWRQLPALCLTGALCSVVVPFVQTALPMFRENYAQRGLRRDSFEGDDAPLLAGKRIAWGFTKLLQQDLCLSHLWLRLFSGGRLHCYGSLLILCIVPFSDCFVEREYSIVKFLIVIYCISAGLTVFATPSSGGDKKHIVAACGGLALCVRVGSAFDPSARSVEEAAANLWPLQIDSTSASAFLMLCIYCVVGMDEVPLLPRIFGRWKDGDRCCESRENSRFRIASLYPLRGRTGVRSCTLERAIFLLQGTIAIFWFAFPDETRSKQPASKGSNHLQERPGTHVDNVFAFLWSVIVFPFKIVDYAGCTFFGWVMPPEPCLFTAPRWLLGVLPPQLLDGTQVRLVPLLNVLLPWAVYLLTAGLWMRLVLILCRMKKRENNLSRQQLRCAKAESNAVEAELQTCVNADGRAQKFIRTEESALILWSKEFWGYFSYYFLITAICPLCMFAILLGRMQLWPLLLCCTKWRLLLLLGRVLVVPARIASGQKCRCCFCVVARAPPAYSVTDASAYCQRNHDADGDSCGSKHRMQYLLTDDSFCMLAALLALDTFFVTGHRTKLSALPIEAGFVGLFEFHPFWSFVMGFLHTYAAYIVYCPLIFMLAFLRPAHLVTDKVSPVHKAVQGLTASAVVQTSALMIGKIAFGILTGVTFKHFCSLLSLTLLRQHLFIWDLFAVKFLYDIIAACLTYVLIVFTLLIVGIGARRTLEVMAVT